MSEEKAALRDALRSSRQHVLGIVEGLPDEDLHRAVLPSGWAIVNLLHHLAVDVERFWFRAVVAGDRSAWDSYGDFSTDGWTVAGDLAAADVLALYRSEAGLADVIIDSTDLDAPPARWPDELFGSFRLDDLREVLLHVVKETATHAGQLDAVRELIDGKQWLVL